MSRGAWGCGIDFALSIHYTPIMNDRPWYQFYDLGVPRNLVYPSVPLPYFLEEAARRIPDNTCTISKGVGMTFRDIDLDTNQIAANLLKMGVIKGDRVGIFLGNTTEFVLAYFGILKAGAVVVATNPAYTLPEIEYQAANAGIKTMFVADQAYNKIKEIQPKTQIETNIVIGNLEPMKGDHRFNDLLTGHGIQLPPVLSDDTALLQYSGGTTGIARGAVALHRSLVANTIQFKTWMVNLEYGKETTLLAIPMYHVYGMLCGMCLSMALGASMVLIPNSRSVDDLLAAVEMYHPTYFPAVPTLFNAINNHPKVQAGGINLSSIKACISGSAPLLMETKEKFESLTGGRLCEGYGLSEAPTATHCNPLLGRSKIGSIGLPLPDVDCRIVDVENGKSNVPLGDVGELILKGPQVMKGYHNDLTESARALRDGWLFTGDLAQMDPDGYFTIVGRKKELIKPDGLQVWPREVEQVIITHPKVLEVAVAGVPDPYHGEAVKAWVVPKPGEDLTVEEIRHWCQDQLASYKIPGQVELRTDLPRSSVGKVLRRELVKQHLEEVKE
jgi:long-chain acyl-CoA synthetase